MSAPKVISRAYPKGRVLTTAQLDALNGLITAAGVPKAAWQLGVRIDVLYRLADQGLVYSQSYGKWPMWSITSKGRAAADEMHAALREGQGHAR